jgi:hypothetical protein
MTDQITAYCGLICNDCQAYIATRQNDTEKLKSLALEWYQVEDNPTFCLCDGCNVAGRKNAHCSECGVRACAIAHEVVNCAHCPEYGCETLTAFFEYVPTAKENLERIRATF